MAGPQGMTGASEGRELGEMDAGMLTSCWK